MIESSIAIATYLFILAFAIAGLFVKGGKDRTGWVIATGFAVLAILLVIGIILHGPVPEENPLTEAETATQCDS